ncbi:GDSL esterase/lipase WDL1-like [Lycium ferocissimum]|uniref:GDSL esterase/lipase WDL1-like n=1 Tax=Lycium ferocissimum TaxID=112874 RepID=UPI0028165426|nr:GDSL esterase/lipase WDL1-like [Lycium ferocissimum]
MVGPIRPLFVLFGSSIVQLSYHLHGWGATLTGLYSRKADISLRGYAGWNSRMALQVLDKVFPKDADIKPSLVILYFGGNDSVDPEFPGNIHVPLEEYVENMRKIVLHIKSLSEKTRIIMLSAPAVNEEQIVHFYGDNRGRTNETSRIYSEAGIKLGQELGVKVIDFWSALQERPDWLTTVFWDGMHLTKEGSDIVVKKISKALTEAEWKPSLHWTKMADEFSDINIPLGADEMNLDDWQKEYE